MGLVNAEPSNQTSTTNSSHPHPLQFSNLRASAVIFNCSMCKLQASGPVYICIRCNFLLHPKCYALPKKIKNELPKQIKHESHQNHNLYLQKKPVYPGGSFRCDACGNPGDGLSYHCSPCGFDLHSTCVSLPRQLMHTSHKHQLRLTFCHPNQGNFFICDVCMTVGSNIWRYRCNTCDFDVHLTCVKPRATKRSTQQPPTNSTDPPNSGAYRSPTVPCDNQPRLSSQTQHTLLFLQGIQQIVDDNNSARMQAIASRTENTLSMLQGFQNIVDNSNKARMQAMLAGGTTGFPGDFGGRFGGEFGGDKDMRGFQ